MSELSEKLDALIPKEAVKTRDQAGRQLQYLSGAYVINRLNEVLGHLRWSYTITRLEKIFSGKAQQKKGVVYAVSYIASVKLRTINDECEYEDVGYGDGFDRTNPGKAHELAVKEAVTDALKRAAKNLGRSMGLGLYFDAEEHIESRSEPHPDYEIPNEPEPPHFEDEPMPDFDSPKQSQRPVKKQGMPFEQAVKAFGEEGCLDALLAQDGLAQDQIEFYESLRKNVRKYKSLTAKQKQALAKCWYFSMVKPYNSDHAR